MVEEVDIPVKANPTKSDSWSRLVGGWLTYGGPPDSCDCIHQSQSRRRRRQSQLVIKVVVCVC